MSKPIVTFTVSVDREGNITSRTQTHDSTFADAYRGFHLIKDEVQRQIDERRNCPFNPINGNDPVTFPDDPR